MSALRQHDQRPPRYTERGASLRREGPGMAYLVSDEVNATSHSWYWAPITHYTTWIRDSFPAVVIVGSHGGSLGYQPPFAEQITRDLDRLTDGWYGPGSKAPGQRVLHDVDVVLAQLSSGKSRPEVEIDEDTGAVTLRWFSADSGNTLAWVFNGDARVVIIHTVVAPETVATSKVFGVDDVSGIVRFFASNEGIGAIFEAA